MTKPRTARTWRVLGRDAQGRVIEHGPFLSAQAAERQARIVANHHGTSQRVTTKGQLGSFTVEPEGVTA